MGLVAYMGATCNAYTKKHSTGTPPTWAGHTHSIASGKNNNNNILSNSPNKPKSRGLAAHSHRPSSMGRDKHKHILGVEC